MASDLLAQVTSEPPRDRFGRPSIIPPGGGKPEPYTRMTTLASAPEDTYNLEKWKMRMVAVGLSDRQDLLLAAAAHRDNKSKLNKVCSDALDAARAGAAALTGTAVHALDEQHDLGTLDLSRVPVTNRPDIEAYIGATACLEVIAVEQFGVIDDLKVGGTWDRRFRYQGREYLGDIKTGSIEWTTGKFAMQMGGYSRSMIYDPATGQRTPLNVDQDWAILVHQPVGTGTCTLHWIDIAQGWKDLQVAAQVRAHRARKNWLKPFNAIASGDVSTSYSRDLDGGEVSTDQLRSRVESAATISELYQLWEKADSEGSWNDTLTQAAADRKRQLTSE